MSLMLQFLVNVSIIVSSHSFYSMIFGFSFYLCRKEVRRILKSSYARVASIVPFFFSGKLIVYFTFLTYILCGNKLTSEVVFVAIGLYNPLRLTMTFFFPVAVQMGSETIVTIRRLQVWSSFSICQYFIFCSFQCFFVLSLNFFLKWCGGCLVLLKIFRVFCLQEFLLLEEMDPASVPILPAGDSPPQVSVDKIESSWEMVCNFSKVLYLCSDCGFFT